MLRGCFARDLSVRSGTEGSRQPPSCHAAWGGKSEGGCRPHASSPTCPGLGSGAGSRKRASTPRTAKGTSAGMPPPCTQSPQGAQHSLRPQAQIATHFPKETHFPPWHKQEPTRKRCWQPPPALLCRRGDARCPPGGRVLCQLPPGCLRREHQHGVGCGGWGHRGAAGALHSTTQPEEEPHYPQGGDPNSGDNKCPHGQEGAALGQMMFTELLWAFLVTPSCPQGSSSRTQGQPARPLHSSQMGDPLPSGTRRGKGVAGLWGDGAEERHDLRGQIRRAHGETEAGNAQWPH